MPSRRRVALLLSLLLAVAVPAAQERPPATPPMPSREEILREIAAARDVRGTRLPTAEERGRVVAKVNGVPITLGEVLDEVLQRFGTRLVTALANQALMTMEVTVRGVEVSDDEFLEEVGRYLAERRRKGRKLSLRRILADARLDWNIFARMLREKAKIAKLVRRDLGLTNQRGPLNPFVLQVWAARSLRRRYTFELDRRKLPPGVFARIEGHRPLADVLRDFQAGRLRRGPREGKGRWLVPARGEGPRYHLPDVPLADGALTTEELLAAAARGASLRVELVLRRADGATLALPPATARREEKPGGGGRAVPLREALAALTGEGYRLEGDAVVPPAGKAGPRFRLPAETTVQVDGRTLPLTRALAAWWRGPKVTLAEVLVVGEHRLPNAPVPMRSDVDREALLRFCFGRLERRHYEEALQSLARFKAVQAAFKARGIQVDEKAVAAAIAAQEKRYNHPPFTRELILQAMGKTIFEENRRLWVANGVDQILRPQVSEKELRAYYRRHLDRYAGAAREVSHILAAARDPETGREDWERARRRIDAVAERLFAHPQPARFFHELARRFSEDETTARQGGRLGPVTRRSPYAKEFVEACFALRAGQISAPVKTVHGYHLILCEKVVPPDPEKYSFDAPETKRLVREEYLQELRDRWLEEHVYQELHLERCGPLLPR